MNQNNIHSFSFRQQQLQNLKRFLAECETDILTALHTDLKKSREESLLTELAPVTSELKHTQKNLRKWMKPKRISTPLVIQPGTSKIYSEPRGSVLIISPWNYPIYLTLMPLIGALAGGNCVVLKPSELASATSQLLAEKLPNYIDHRCLTIVQGGVTETTALLNEKFDYIFYTGSTSVGQVIMTAAAKHLTPVTLELGGKSPCIIDATANIDLTARRLMWSKFCNAGQICIAPDYVLIDHSIKDKLLEKCKSILKKFYGDDPSTSPFYSRIVNQHHYQRLINLLKTSGDIYLGGQANENENYIAPTILHNVPLNAPIMQEEIFGPILPIITYHHIDEAISFINDRPKPLSLYLFSSNKATQQKIINNTSSGSVSINYPLLQVANPNLPFGGIGPSGIGAYHGKASFDTFTHFKSVLIKPTWFDLSLFYPPYTEKLIRLLRWLMF